MKLYSTYQNLDPGNFAPYWVIMMAESDDPSAPLIACPDIRRFATLEEAEIMANRLTLEALRDSESPP